jgi:hypothetical protein
MVMLAPRFARGKVLATVEAGQHDWFAMEVSVGHRAAIGLVVRHGVSPEWLMKQV